MNRWKWYLAVLLVTVIGVGAVHQASAQQKKPYKYVIWDLMAGQSEQYTQMIKKLVTFLFARMQEPVDVITMSRGDVLKAVNAKKIDFTTLLQSDYVDLVAAGKNVTPMLTVSPAGHLNEYKCVLVPKGSDAKDYQSFKGKRLTMPATRSDYYGDRIFFKGKGIDMPLNKFFSQVTLAIDDSASLTNVIEGKADVGIIAGTTINFRKYVDPASLKKVTTGDCFEFQWPGAPVVWVGTPDKNAVNKLSDVLSNLDKDEEFKKYWKPLLNVMKMRLNFVTPKDFDPLVKAFAQAKKSGWDAEYKKIGGK